VAETRAQLRRVLAEFMAIPLGIVLGFLVLAFLTNALDHAEVGWLRPLREWLQQAVFADAQATGNLLETIASSLITVTSITFSLLLIAVQQAAASLTSQVLDQYLRRRLNQAVFGFFVGLSLYALLILSTVDDPYNPVFGATLALILMAVALAILPLLLYATLDQMRPAEIVEAIHDHTLIARQNQRSVLRCTRRAPSYHGPVSGIVRASTDGFVTDIDVDALGAAARATRGEIEIIIRVPIGTYVAYQDVVAEVRAQSAADVAAVEQAVCEAVNLDRERDLDSDPAYGIQQLETIAWTAISTSKQDPAPGLLVVQRFRDLLVRWCIEGEAAQPGPEDEPLPVVYPDTVVDQLMDGFEALAVVSSESMQHRIYAEVVRSLALTFDRLPAAVQARAEDLICRILSGLGDHVLTADLDATLSALADALASAERHETAAAVKGAQAELRGSLGKLNSRATRVPK
jgi:uncharacterized membrane protein